VLQERWRDGTYSAGSSMGSSCSIWVTALLDLGDSSGLSCSKEHLGCQGGRWMECRESGRPEDGMSNSGGQC
jgi:hypothetical protein